jgi:hypothetical protein
MSQSLAQRELMDTLGQNILNLFASFKKETLDLHSLFEAGGNDPDARTAVLDKVDRLVEGGLLEERGNDFYALTAEGRANLTLDHKG